MAYRVIEIPFGSTTLDDNPIIEIVSKSDEMLKLIIKYCSSPSSEEPRIGELTFTKVFQYRWTYGDAIYREFDSDPGYYAFALYEVVDSPYFADALAKSQKYHGGHGLGDLTKFYNIRHFRLGFDEYGRFDILAENVSVREIDLSA